MASDSGQARQSQERDPESSPNQWQEGARKSARQGDCFLYVDSQALSGLRKELIKDHTRSHFPSKTYSILQSNVGL